MTLLFFALCFLIGWWAEVFFAKASRPRTQESRLREWAAAASGSASSPGAPPPQAAPAAATESFLTRRPVERRDQVIIAVLVLGLILAALCRPGE